MKWVFDLDLVNDIDQQSSHQQIQVEPIFIISAPLEKLLLQFNSFPEPGSWSGSGVSPAWRYLRRLRHIPGEVRAVGEGPGSARVNINWLGKLFRDLGCSKCALI